MKRAIPHVRRSQRTFLILLSMILLSMSLQAQYSYTSFNGDVYKMRVIEKKYIVLLVPSDKIITDEVALDSVAERMDRMYEYYKLTMGFEPGGGLSAFSNKCPVAIVKESCGAGCGLIGAKGIEVGEFLEEMIFEARQNSNLNRIGIVGYEFGRNFYTGLIGSKLSFPTNRAILTNGFATFLGLKATFYARTINPANRLMNETQYFFDELYNGTIAYLVDSSMNTSDFFFSDNLVYKNEFSRVPRGIYPGAALMVFLDSTLTSEKLFPRFWTFLTEQPDANSDQDVLDNIAVSASFAVGNDLSDFFINVLKFNLSQTAISKILTLPAVNNLSLIRDVKNYEVADLNNDLSVLTASVGHNTPGLFYKVVMKTNSQTVFEDTTSNSFLKLPITKCFSTCESSADRRLTVYSVYQNALVDSTHMNFHYRDTISTAVSLTTFAENSWLGSFGGTGWSQIDPIEKSIQVFANGQILDDNGVEFPFQAFKDRVYTLKALVHTSSNARAIIRYGGGVGITYSVPVTSTDATYTPVELTFSVNIFDSIWLADGDGKMKIYLSLGNDVSNEVQHAYFKDVEIIDVTASEVLWNLKPEKPIITYSTDKLFSNYQTGNQWFFNGNIIPGATDQTYIPTVSGDYQVVATDGNCYSEFSDPVHFYLASVDNITASDVINLYPNPVKDMLTIQCNGNRGIVRIYDLLGKHLISEEIVNPIKKIDVSGWDKGTYVLEIISKTKVESVRFIKQ